MRPSRRLPRWMVLLLRLSLLMYPRPRRIRFRREITDAFSRTLAAECEHGRARWWIAVRMSTDIAVSGVRERLRALRSWKTEFRNPFGGGSLGSDMRSLRRSFLQNPNHHIVVASILAVGIGVTTAVFPILDSTVLKPLPYHNADRLMAVWPYEISAPDDEQNVSWLNYVDLRARLDETAALAARRGTRSTLTGIGDPTVVHVELVTPNLLRLLGAVPLHGRLLTDQDDRNTTQRVAMVTYAFWQRMLGSDPAAVGGAIMLDGVSHEVVGVLRPQFRLPRQLSSNSRVDVVTTAQWYGETNQRGWRRFNVYGMLDDTATLGSAEAALQAAYATLTEQYPVANQGLSARLVPLAQSILGGMNRQARRRIDASTGGSTEIAWMTTAAGLLLLVVAVANAAGLLLARGVLRRQEFVLRTALGASRWRLVRQLLLESTVIALVAGAAGIGVAHFLLPFVVSLLPAGLPRLADVTVDTRVLSFTLAVSLTAGFVAGLAPIARLRSVASGLRTVRGTHGRADSRLFKLIVVAELAVALVLLIGSGLLAASSVRLAHVDSGLSVSQAVAFEVRLSHDVHGDEGIPVAFDAIYERVRAIPGVERVGATWILPLVGGSSQDSYRYMRNREVNDGTAEFGIVAPGYYAAVGRPVIRGRPFTESDVATSEPVAIVSESFARRTWPGEIPLVRKLVTAPGSGAPWSASLRTSSITDWRIPVRSSTTFRSRRSVGPVR